MFTPKKTTRLILVLIIFTLVAFPVSGKVIEGVIKNVNFGSIDVAKIKVKETGKYFYSGEGGRFKVDVPDEYDAVTLVFVNSFYYMKTMKVKLDKEIKKIEVLLVPREHLKETVSVTALSYEEKAVSVPMAESVVSEVEIKEKIAENLVSTMQNSPGVHFIGSGGFSVTPSIRGLARRRVLLLADGARITSDRRAGTSASFMAPELIKRIEVVRSSSSVLYGSDAVGGVVQFFTRPDLSGGGPKNSLNLNINPIHKRTSGGITLAKQIGNVNIYSGFQLADSGNYSSPDDEILNSGYTNYSGLLNLAFQWDKRDLFIGYMGGYGKDVGKPTRDNDPEKFTTVPVDSDHFFNLQYSEKGLIENGDIGLQFYGNPQKYTIDKTDLAQNKREYSETTGFNYGLKLNFTKNISKYFSYRVGLEQFSRRNLKITNSMTQNDETSDTAPLQNGKRDDLGIYLTFDYSGLRGFDFMGGVRYTFFNLQADAEGVHHQIKDNAPSAFLGVTKKIGNSFNLFVNLGRAYRTPSLSEAFYTGITGRRYVIANPELVPEKSFNVDTGIKFFSQKVFLGLYLFTYQVDDMIERYRNDEGLYTHDNIIQGRIRGAEFEYQFFPWKELEIFGHFFFYESESKSDGQPLNDIPSPKLLLGAKYYINKFWCEVNYLHSFEKNDPGPSEEENDAYRLLDLKAGYYFSGNLFLYLKASNLLNESYYANPDPDIPLSQKMNISAGINFYF